jgi:hypothetical protein
MRRRRAIIIGMARPPVRKFSGVAFGIASLAVYGDLFKRAASAELALLALYAIASGLLLVLVIGGSPLKRISGSGLIAPFVALILIYLVQLLANFDAPLVNATMGAFYMVVPLAFIIITIMRGAEFPIMQLTLYVSLLMIPAHIVGFIQYSVDPSFMISTAYDLGVRAGSGIEGGIIQRNFLDGSGIFARYPSIFASADRYSAVSMMQLLLAVYGLSQKNSARSQFETVLLASGLVVSLVGLAVAGARSRFIILGVAILSLGLALFVSYGAGRIGKAARSAISLGLAAMLIFSFGMVFDGPRNWVLGSPVYTMLETTIATGDAQDRLGEALDASSIPDNVTLFGAGLGTSAAGRPGEMGIRAMWIEGGFFWTILMLGAHLSIIIFVLTRYTLGHIFAGRGGEAFLWSALSLNWIFALLAGFSSSFELSSGVLYCCLLGRLISSRSSGNSPRYVRPNQAQYYKERRRYGSG